METIFASLLILLVCLGPARAYEPADSLAFAQKRRQILADAPDENRILVLDAAEDLARDGYYAEAMDLIYSLEDSSATAALADTFLTDTLPGKIARPPLESPASVAPAPSMSDGYVQTSMDYDDWDAQAEPVGGRVRALMEWTPRGGPVERVTSVFQGSNRNAYFDLAGKGAAFGRMLKAEAEGLAEKKLWQAYGDSLDRIFLQARMEANTRPLGKALSAILPVRAEAEQFRFSRFGSLSSQSFWAAPGLEAVSGDLRRTLSLSWEMQQTRYPSEPAAGSFRQGPVAWGEWYGNRISADWEGRFQTYRYIRDTSLFRQRELEARAGFFVRTWPWLKTGFRSVGESEWGDYRDSVDLTSLSRVQADYRLRGATWSIQPQLVWEWTAYTATLALAYGRGYYPVLARADGQDLEIPKYLYGPFEDWKPSLGLTILAKTIFLNLSLEYEINTVASDPIYSTGSSQGAGLNGNLFWKLRPWFEIDFTCMAERRLDDGALPGRIQDLATVSLGMTSRFP